nr:chromo domain containing protein [Trichoderma aurantioeffusum]
MAAIPPLFTPGKGTRASPRTSLGASSSAVAQNSPRLKKKTPGSSRRKSFARKLIDSETTSHEDDNDVHNASGGVGDSVQLEQDEVASASTPRASKAADTTIPSGSQPRVAGAAFTGSISDIIDQETVEAPETVEEEYGFKRLVGYRWVGDSIEVQVEWDTGDITWEPEANLHEDAPEALFEYWSEQGGRPKNPADPEIYEVFAILKHNKNRTRLLVEWVGFKRSEASWASRKILEETAKDIVDAYFDSLKTTRRKN